jgi:hypothetical protein
MMATKIVMTLFQKFSTVHTTVNTGVPWSAGVCCTLAAFAAVVPF